MTQALPQQHAAEFTAPARVNLLGEHTDYTGGLVLPMAIPFFTTASIAPSADDRNHFSSELFHETHDFAVDDRSEARGEWSDYPRGVLHELRARGLQPPAFALNLGGNVPLGSGLSSSASVEVASALAMLSLRGASLPEQDIAVLCRRAENDFVHSPCGIMDQFVITAAQAGHALLLNTRTLRYEQLPMNTGKLAATRIVVCNSMVKHSVASGEYGVRHRQVMEGQQTLRAKFPDLLDLGQATLEQLEACKAGMSPESYLRCRHIITENARVLEAKKAMFAGDPVAFGTLMTQGHGSERDDFACSCAEIDFLVEIATRLPGCYGARLTGGGFGGCTVNLVDQTQTDAFAAELKRAYRERFHMEAETFVCEAVDGALRRNAAALKDVAA